LDGGGVRGALTLGILERVEALLRERQGAGREDFVLADYFDFIGGTSTGAIIASMLAWGCSVEEVKGRYQKMGPQVFEALPLWRAWRHKFRAEGLEQFLREFFVEEDGSPATLGTTRLRSRLLVVLPITSSTGAPSRRAFRISTFRCGS
jgi:patatin-like phospholipase/acyl hydrolase